MDDWLKGAKRPAACLLLGFLCWLAAARALAAGHPVIDPGQGWVALFDGKDLTGWKVVDPRGRQVDADAWTIEGETLTRTGKGYLASQSEYGDFILDLEFKVGPKTNSGIILRFDPEYSAGKPMYWWNGLIEIQIFDSHGAQEVGKHDCGALYDMVAPGQNAMRKPGEWNRVTITAKGSRIVVIMNEVKIIEADLDDWNAAEKNPDGTPNKYHQPMKDAPRRGHIMLQDHPGEIWFRDIYIKPLD